MADERQETLAECLDRIAGLIGRDRPLRLQNARGHERDVVAREESDLKHQRWELLKLLEFIQNCKVVIQKPKVTRVRGRNKGAISHKHRFVMPIVNLVWKDRKVLIESLEDLSEQGWHYDDKANKVPILRFPWIYMRWGQISFYQQHHMATSKNFSSFEEEIARAFLHEAGEHWTNMVRAARAEWDRVQSNLDTIVDEQFEKKGENERAEFRTKFTKMLMKSSGLIDAPPEALLAFFKLGYAEIEKFARFTTQNKADISLVELDDVVTAQQEAQVRKVMES